VLENIFGGKDGNYVHKPPEELLLHLFQQTSKWYLTITNDLIGIIAPNFITAQSGVFEHSTTNLQVLQHLYM
jgi:hypothetical protein